VQTSRFVAYGGREIKHSEVEIITVLPVPLKKDFASLGLLRIIEFEQVAYLPRFQ